MAADRLPDPAAGMPLELVRALRDPTIRLPQDDYKLADGRSLWEHLQEWRNAPSDTASGGPVSAAVSPAEPPPLRPLDPRLQHHAYGGVEHRTTDPVEGCLLCTLEAVAAAWFEFRQDDLDVLLNDYRKDNDA